MSERIEIIDLLLVELTIEKTAYKRYSDAVKRYRYDTDIRADAKESALHHMYAIVALERLLEKITDRE